MHCNKCEEDVPDSKLLKHLRDYHAGEKDLDIKCPGCGTVYSNSGSFQKHWYAKHHPKKRKESSAEDIDPSTGGKKFCDRESISSLSKEIVDSAALCDLSAEPKIPAASSSLSNEILDDAGVGDPSSEQHVVTRTSISSKEIVDCMSDIAVEQQPVASTSCESTEVARTSISSKEIVDFVSDITVEQQPVASTSSESTEVACDSEYESDSDVSDDEPEDGMHVEDAVNCTLPRTSLPSVNVEAASFLLNLNSACNIPSSSIDLVISETEKLIKSCVLNFASIVSEKLRDINVSLDQVIDINTVAASVSRVFENIKSDQQQKNVFKEMLGVINPKPIPLGNVLKKVRRKGHIKTVVKSENLMFIPITETMDKLMNHPDFEHLTSTKENTEFLDSYMKGEKCKTNPVIIEHPQCLRFKLYYDDLEACSPLKSKAGVHKLGAFYLLLDNIAPKYCSNLSLIFLLALVNANYVKDKKYGMDSALEVIVAELQKFENGVVLPSGKKVYGTLIATIGDNLGSHAIGGFKEGFTAHCCCRNCMATYEQCQKMVVEDPKLMRTVESHADQCAQVQTLRGKNEVLSTKYGVNRDSALNSLTSYHVVGGLPPDPMHDILEGALPLQIKHLLNHFLNEEKEKKFSLDWLNSAIQSFDLGYAEAANRPSEIKKDHLKEDGSLHQSASQIWLLACILPLVIAPLLDKDDKHFENFLELLDICRVVFSTDIPKWMVYYLRDMIESYLSNYISLYGNLIPKQHYLLHYVTWLLQNGALTNYNCMRCEAKHKFFKRLVNVMGNFKNVPLSLSYKHQLHMAASWAKGLKKTTTCGPCRLVNVNETCYKRLFPGYVGNVIESNWLNYEGDTYKPDNCFLCVGFEEDLPIFVKLFKVLIYPAVQLVCEKVSTIRRRIYYAAYEIEVLENDMRIVKVESLSVHNVLHAHRVKDAFFITMKYCGGGLVL